MELIRILQKYVESRTQTVERRIDTLAAITKHTYITQNQVHETH